MFKKEVVKVKSAFVYILDKKRAAESVEERECLGVAFRMLEEKLLVLEELNKAFFMDKSEDKVDINIDSENGLSLFKLKLSAAIKCGAPFNERVTIQQPEERATTLKELEAKAENLRDKIHKEFLNN